MATNLVTLFQDRVYRSGSKTAAKYKEAEAWKDLSWDDLGLETERIGRGLLSLGVRPGDRVAILSNNRPEWVTADLAILSIGAVTVPIYPTASPEQVEFILGHSKARIVLASVADGGRMIPEAMNRLQTIEAVVWFDPLGPADSHGPAVDSRAIPFAELKSKGEGIRATAFYDRLEQTRADDLATIVYTSGTTGEPKGVMLSQGNILANCTAAAEVFPIQENDVFLSFLPLSHMLERTAGFYTVLLTGATVAFAESIPKLAQNLQEVRPTILVTVPRVMEKIHDRIVTEVSDRSRIVRYFFHKALNATSKTYLKFSDRMFFKKIRMALGGRIRFIICGGAAMNAKVGEFFRLVGLNVLEGYGLTEASPIVCVNPPKNNRPGTVGRPLPGLTLKTADDGEVLVHGPSVMKGYYQDAEATRAAVDSEGFLHTGDIGNIDPEGFLKLTDRKKELIVTSGGKNVAPSPIENALKSHPLVGQACVVGDGKKYVAALLVPNFGLLEKKAAGQKIASSSRSELLSNPTVREWFGQVVNDVNAHLSGYEAVKKFALVPREFSMEENEVTPSLKLKRRIIQEHFRDLIDELFS